LLSRTLLGSASPYAGAREALDMSAPVEVVPATTPGDLTVRFADDAGKLKPSTILSSAAPTRTMVSGACVFCACVSARRWYCVDEEVDDETEAVSAPIPSRSTTTLTYIAGSGTSRERILPLVLAPRSLWSGAGANAPPNTAQLCSHCHVQNEQLWGESGSVVSDRGSNLASVRDTMRNFDRIMHLLAPGTKARPQPGRPRRRAGKHGHHGGVVRTTTTRVNDDENYDVQSMSKSAPASSLVHAPPYRPSPLSHTRAALRDQSLQAELIEAQELGQRRRRRWANDRLLRELGGAMTITEMQAQFSPPPFGAPPVPTAFELMLSAQRRGEWSGFHKVDMDKERLFLSSLAENTHKKRQARRTSCGSGPGNEARGKWAGVSQRARVALRSVARRSPERLERLESGLLDFAAAARDVDDVTRRAIRDRENEGQRASLVHDDDDDRTLVLPLHDAFARLLAHGLCEFHGLRKTSRVALGGGKELVVSFEGGDGDVGDDRDVGDVGDEFTAGDADNVGDDAACHENVRVSPPAPAVTCVAFLKTMHANTEPSGMERRVAA